MTDTPRYGTVLITTDAPDSFRTALLDGCKVLRTSQIGHGLMAHVCEHPAFDPHPPLGAPQYIAFLDPETGKRGPWRRASWR